MIEKLINAINNKKQELIELTQTLVRIPTINPPGNYYKECNEYIGNRLKNKGFEVTYIRAIDSPGDSDEYPRINMIARHEGNIPGPCIHFNSHIDVVEVGSGWTMEPFIAEHKDGRIYGRGTCDMKGGLAASIIACESMIEVFGKDHPGVIEISGTVDEESGGFAGVGYLSKLGYFSKPRVDYVIIPEPLGVNRICTGHRGVWWFEVEIIGKSAHGSMPFFGNSSIFHMTAFIQQIEEFLIPKLSMRKTSSPVEPKQARVSTININSLHGGQQLQHYKQNKEGEPIGDLPTSLVPDKCIAVIDRRFIIEENIDDVKREIKDILDYLSQMRGFNYNINDIMIFNPTFTSNDSLLVNSISKSIHNIIECKAKIIASPGTYDQKHIVCRGLHECVAYGPGILELAHQPDEYIIVDDLMNSCKIMAMTIMDLYYPENTL